LKILVGEIKRKLAGPKLWMDSPMSNCRYNALHEIFRAVGYHRENEGSLGQPLFTLGDGS
jgi:hypothetical protein